MFKVVSKRKLKKCMEEIKQSNRATTMQDYAQPISEEQKTKNAYWQGYEDGTDNMYNALVFKMKL